MDWIFKAGQVKSGVESMDWEQHYAAIRKRLSLNFAGDEASARMLDGLLSDADARGLLKPLLKGKPCLVFGAGPSLEGDFYRLEKKGLLRRTATVVADGATTLFLKDGIIPDVVVTDLDGPHDDLVAASKKGSVFIVHAHGDNQKAIASVVPRLSGPVIGSTQTKPFGRLHVFGGFTDGDRAVAVALRFEASPLILAGMDFGITPGHYSHEYDVDVKREKLVIAGELIQAMAGETSVPLYNVTGKGDDVEGVSRIGVEDLVGVLEDAGE